MISGNLYNIVAGSDGGIWSCDYNNSVVHRVDPATGITAAFSMGLTNLLTPNYFITAGLDGNLWFTFADIFGASAIGKTYAAVPGHIGDKSG